MNVRFHLLATSMLYIFMIDAFAHPGPHSHSGVAEGAWHAFIGLEFALALMIVGAVWFVVRRARINRRT